LHQFIRSLTGACSISMIAMYDVSVYFLAPDELVPLFHYLLKGPLQTPSNTPSGRPTAQETLRGGMPNMKVSTAKIEASSS